MTADDVVTIDTTTSTKQRNNVSPVKTAANMNRGANIAHTMRCLFITLTDMHDATVSVH